jgi:tryptophan halogenase
MSEDEAQKTLLNNLDGKLITDPRTIRFRTGRRLKQWNKNCVALGLASGFLEPLESTSIHLIQNSIIRLIKLFPSAGIEQSEVDQFNREVRTEIEFIRDFIIAHYHVTQRSDNVYWNECREMAIPDTLAHKLQLFDAGGKIFRDNNELFSEPSWVAVLVGQGIVPKEYHPFVDNMSDKELRDLMVKVKSSISQLVKAQPAHHEYIAKICG